MPNPNAPFGFRVVTSKSGNPSNKTNEYVIASGYATALFFGDAVTLDGSGQVNIATAGAAIIGIFQGCRFTDSSGNSVFRKNWVASTVSSDAVAIVADDPNLVLEAQSVGSMTAADIGQLCDISTGTAGSAVTGFSGQQTSATGGSENQFRIYGVYGVGVNQKPVRGSTGNQEYLSTGTNAQVLLTIANHLMAGSAVAVEA